MQPKTVSRLAAAISRDLQSAAASYHKIGMDVFFKTSTQAWVDFQPAIGNLAIGVELLLKALIAKRALGLLYANLAQEAKLALFYPESTPTGFNEQALANDLTGFHYRSIDLEQAISVVFMLEPGAKHQFKQFLAALASARNISVHSATPQLQRFELDRIAYHATRIFLWVADSKLLDYFYMKPDDKTQSFLGSYKDDKIRKVEDALARAKTAVKKTKLDVSYTSAGVWEQLEVRCPVCGNGTLFEGQTEAGRDGGDTILTFWCESFACEVCGLTLEDEEEIRLAGMDTAVDRSDDVDRWRAEFGDWDESQLFQ